MPLIYKNGGEVIDLASLPADELYDLIEDIPVGSEDEYEKEDDNSDGEFQPQVITEEFLESYFEQNGITEMSILVPAAILENPTNEASSVSTSNGTLSIQSVNLKDLKWRKRHLGCVPSTFTGNSYLPATISGLQTPYQFFKYFVDDDLLDKIVEESLKYSITKNTENPFTFSRNDLMKYLGICVMSSVATISNTRMYWNEHIGIDLVQNTMSQKKFEKIRSNLHFNDNSVVTNDKLHKLRPVIDSLSSKFLSVPMEEMLSIDEQICATKARHHLKQYLPLKPNKWGYKLFILSGVSGFCYKFEIYTGTENQPEQRYSSEPDLGASSNVVVRLARDIPPNSFHKLYFDNYYTSVPLVAYLANKGIHSLGTVRRNRVPSCRTPTDAEAKKIKRGTSGEFVTDYQGIDITNVYWKDNKIVNLLSSFVGTEPMHVVDRYDRKQKTKIQIPCPAIVKQYNKHMGGVDLLDSIIGRYKIKMRSRKWYMRIFYHLLDVAIINAWLLHRKSNEPSMKLIDFRIEIARTLCAMGTPTSVKRGRPSEVQRDIEEKRKKKNTYPLPTVDVRLDHINHIPIWNATRLRCKHPRCNSQTYIVCEKCSTALCLNKDKNCFKSFHENN